jgi:hypothetical protein
MQAGQESLAICGQKFLQDFQDSSILVIFTYNLKTRRT